MPPKLSRKIEDTGRRCIFVLGMHRSGTSAITRVINLLGYALPESLLGENDSNRLGHWESTEVIALNEDILQSAGGRWDDWTPFNAGWYETPLAAGYLERAREVIRAEFADAPMLVLKDPRICRVAPLWLKALDEEGIDVRVAFPVRHPLEVSTSLYRRDQVRVEYGKLLWLRYVLDAELASRERKRFFFTYDQLLADWPVVLERMADALGWPWARKSAEVNQQIDAFLSPRHRTQRLGELGTREHDAWTRSTFEVFERWSNSGDDPEGRGVLDQIRASFDAAAPTFAGLLTPARDSRAATDTMNMEETNAPAQAANSAPEAGGEPEQADSSAAEREAEGGEQQQQQPADPSEPSAAENGLPAHAELLSLIDGIRSVQEDLRKEAERRAERLTGDLRGSEQRIAELESNLRQRQEENAQAWVELEREKAARQTAEQKAEELKAAELRLESLTRLMRDAEAKEERLTRDIGALKSEIEDLKSKLSEKDSELADKDSALADAEEQKRMSKRTAAILQSEREDALGRLAAVEYELTAAKSGLEAAESNLDAARENIDERFAELASLGRILIEEETQRKRFEAQSSWLRQVNEVVLRKGKWWWQLMPREWQRRMRLRQVARAGLFDADTYVRAYPDVAKSGQDPLRHYVAHGLDENRQF